MFGLAYVTYIWTVSRGTTVAKQVTCSSLCTLSFFFLFHSVSSGRLTKCALSLHHFRCSCCPFLGVSCLADAAWFTAFPRHLKSDAGIYLAFFDTAATWMSGRLSLLERKRRDLEVSFTVRCWWRSACSGFRCRSKRCRGITKYPRIFSRSTASHSLKEIALNPVVATFAKASTAFPTRPVSSYVMGHCPGDVTVLCCGLLSNYTCIIFTGCTMKIVHYTGCKFMP